MKVKTYTRNDILDKISFKLNMNKNESKIILDCLLGSFSELLLDDNNLSRIELRDFGVFSTRLTKKRTNARNPRTKENVVIPERKKIVFKAGKKIRNQLNSKQLN
tara:strand:- start:2579 stop:2893 length:315 start_codon:yes stop_codon:yes gene_type:complete